MQNRHNAIVNSNTAGYLHWWCSQNNSGDGVLIRLAGDTYQVSARLWAFAGFFRFARPGSVRVDATSSAENLYVSSFVNPNGTLAIPVINEAHFQRSVDISLTGHTLNMKKATAYLADNTHNNTVVVATYTLNGTGLTASVPPRSMMTFFFE
jgi:O-glycosyl hydrolase